MSVLTFVFVEIGEGATTACDLCGSPATPVYAESDEAVRRIEEAAASAPVPGPNLMLGGADAFGHPALPTLVGAAVRAGAVRIGLETEGGALAAGGNAAGALHVGVRHVRVRYRDSQRALQGIAAWVHAADVAGVDAVATVVIPLCTHTITDVANDVAMVAQAGAIGVTLDATDLKPSVRTTASLVAACDTGMVNGVWVEVDGSRELLPESHALHRVRVEGRA